MTKKVKHSLVEQDVMAIIQWSNRTIETTDKITSPNFILPQVFKIFY